MNPFGVLIFLVVVGSVWAGVRWADKHNDAFGVPNYIR